MTGIDFTAQAALRMAVLEALGAAEGAERFTWPTVSAALRRAQGALWIAADLEPSPDDMDALATLLELAGFDNETGGQFRTDPGEPVEIMGFATWALSIPVPVG